MIYYVFVHEKYKRYVKYNTFNLGYPKPFFCIPTPKASNISYAILWAIKKTACLPGTMLFAIAVLRTRIAMSRITICVGWAFAVMTFWDEIRITRTIHSLLS